MSAQEIIAELPNLSADELTQVGEKLRQLEIVSLREPRTPLGRALMEIAGSVVGPEDWSENHDHYIHGTPKIGEGPVR